MHPYRTHTCNDLRPDNVGQSVRLSGWVHRKRDFGGLLFVDLRDHYGITQIIVQPSAAFFDEVSRVKPESVVTITGKVVAREQANPCSNFVRNPWAANKFGYSGPSFVPIDHDEAAATWRRVECVGFNPV